MIIFYTIGLPEVKYYNELPDAFFQSFYSIYTIRKQWENDDKIIIYTNYSKPYEKLFNLKKHFYSNIEFRTIPDEYKRQTYYYSPYGHSRNFLVYDLLNEFNDYILYLDPDTGLRNGATKESKNILYSFDKPALYRRETYNPFNFWSGKTLHSVIDFERELFLPNNICAINNGVMLFPNNGLGIFSAQELRRYYDYVYDKINEGIKKGILEPRDICFADMFSASIVYYKQEWTTLYDDSFYNVVVDGKIKFDNERIPILHYYNYKWKNGTSKWEKAKQKILEITEKEFKNEI